MATIIDYIKHNKNRSFDDFPLNEVDILCLNEIGYFSFEEVLDQDFNLTQEIRFQDYLQVKGYEPSLKYDFLITRERVNLLRLMLTSERFKDLRLSHYINDIDVEYERQFAAMVFSLPEINHRQLVFRGTDDTLIGWKEDFKLTYMREISAHRSAISYLENYLSQTEGTVVVSGHSKGGNLALYGTSHLHEKWQSKISKVYMFDAPGLQEEGLLTAGYQTIRPKLRVIRPEESIVGVMLYNDVKPLIVKSQSFGIMQHAATNWQVDVSSGHFLMAEKSTDLSLNLEQTFKQWTSELSNQELKILFDTLFDTLMSTGITSLNDLTATIESGTKLATAIANFKSVDAEKKIILTKSAKLFFAAFAEHSRLGLFDKKRDITLPDLSNLKDWFDRRK